MRQLKRKLLRSLGRVLGIEKALGRIRHHRLRLENRLDAAGRTTNAAVCHWLIPVAQTPGPAEFAWVSPLPPMNTGLANFSQRLALENPAAFDLFATYETLEEALDYSVPLHPVARVFPPELLGMAAASTPYRAVIFSLGNSSHNLFVARRLWTYGTLPGRRPVAVDVHDPCLYNLVRISLGDDSKVTDRYVAAYGERVRGIDVFDYSALRARGICGLKALLFQTPIDYLIVHSRSARNILVADLGDGKHPMIIDAFHPVFETPAFPENFYPFAAPAVGCFGIPGNDKYFEEKVRALKALLKRRVIGSAVFAGYHAKQRFQERFGGIPAGFHVYDSPSDSELAGLMDAIDVGLQLRRFDLGESSGVVPQLLRLGKTVVCNEIGAFADYGQAVCHVPPPVDPAAIYSTIERAIREQGRTSEFVRNYVADHGSPQFLALLRRSIPPPRSFPSVAQGHLLRGA
jgi:hypothetical protein